MVTSSDPLVGSTLADRYDIVSRVARGGMACVYAAYDQRLERTVAVKVMHESLRDDVEFARKFQREARSAAKLTHPNVVAVFDQGCDHDRPYIVMEYVEGETLRRIISREAPLPPLECLELMEPILSALAAAHDQSIIHRDVKPENVLVGNHAEVKVADFGLAKAVSGDTVTATQGLLLGTVSYIAPELVADGRADTYSDVYSAGIMLFEMLTGEKPHTGDTPIQVAYAHCQRDVPAPSSRGPQNRGGRDAIPGYLDTLVRHATAREPSERIPNARAFLNRVRQAKQALESGITASGHLDEAMSPAGSSLAPAVLPPSPVVTPQSPATPSDNSGSVSTTPDPANTPAANLAMSTRKVRASAATRSSAATITTDTDEHTPSWRMREIPPQQPRRYRAFLVGLAVLLVGSLIGYGIWFSVDGQYTTTPALEGKSRDEAVDAAKHAKLQVKFAEEFSERFPQGAVARTDPGAGTKVKVNSVVSVLMSKGAERSIVPAVEGKTRTDAEQLLAKASVRVGSVTEKFETGVAPGVVISASKPAGTALKRDETVDLVVSKGAEPVSVPDYSGQDAPTAKAALEKLGLKVTLKQETSDAIREGKVMSQSVKGNAKKGDALTLTVSSGPAKVTLPKVVGLTEDKAVAALEAAGFKVAVRQTSGNKQAKVTQVDPVGSAPAGSTVTIVMS